MKSAEIEERIREALDMLMDPEFGDLVEGEDGAASQCISLAASSLESLLGDLERERVCFEPGEAKAS